MSAFTIPRPCAQPWAAMPATAAGRHCAACATEVVDFTRMSEAEILVYLTGRVQQPVCGYVRPVQLTPPLAPVPRWRRWLLAALAVLGWPAGTSARLPMPLPLVADSAPGPRQPAQVTVRGSVLDGQDNQPVGGARVFIKGTRYGAVTDDQGRFELVMPARWKPLQGGRLTLHVEGSPFAFVPQDVPVALRNTSRPLALTITLRSVEGRGNIMGRMVPPTPPVKPPTR